MSQRARMEALKETFCIETNIHTGGIHSDDEPE